MCLYPLRIRNPGYESLVDCQRRSLFSDSTGDVIPPDYEVDVPCGKCWQCLRQKRFETVLRLKVEQSVIPPGTRSYFVTLTFNQECYVKYASDYGLCVRRWLDKLRKRYGRFRYWFISELGEKTHRLHFHGILFGMPDIPYKELCSAWIYGISWYGYCTDRTCGYITKYMIKQQIDKGQVYKPIKIYSKSIGSGRNNSGVDFEVPVYADNQNFIERAEYYLSQGDLKSSVVYLRSELENRLKKFCDKHNLAVKYKLNQRKLTTEDFLQPVMQKIGDDALKSEIELHRTVILNPLSHSTIASIESKEVKKSIGVIQRFITKLSKINEEQQIAQRQTLLKAVVEKVNKELDFEIDIYQKLIDIKSTVVLNEFLKEDIYKNITKFSITELERFFDEMRLAQKVSIFDLETEANFIRIFTKKDWEARQKQIWCRFVQFLNNEGKLQDKFFIQKLEEKNALKKEWVQYRDWETDRKSTRLNSSHITRSRMPSSA